MENVNSNRCKAEQNEHESKSTFPYAILRSLRETESISTWKNSTHTHRVRCFFSPTETRIYLRGHRNTKLCFEFLGQNTNIRSLYQELDILCRQQCQCALWQSSLLPAPSSLWPRGGPSDHISSSSSCHFTGLLKHLCPRSDLGSFWVALTYFSAVSQDPVYWLPTLWNLTERWMQIYGRYCVMDN